MNSRNFVLSILILLPLMMGCVEDETILPAGDPEELMNEITALAESVNCVDSENWAFTAFGSKPCGGPMGFLAYSTDIDTEYFLAIVETHRKAQEAANKKSGAYSDCSVPTKPTGIKCSNGKPVLVY